MLKSKTAAKHKKEAAIMKKIKGHTNAAQGNAKQSNLTAIESSIKKTVVWLAVRDLLSFRTAELIIRRLHLEAA